MKNLSGTEERNSIRNTLITDCAMNNFETNNSEFIEPLQAKKTNIEIDFIISGKTLRLNFSRAIKR
jgi:hypothetical protein